MNEDAMLRALGLDPDAIRPSTLPPWDRVDVASSALEYDPDAGASRPAVLDGSSSQWWADYSRLRRQMTADDAGADVDDDELAELGPDELRRRIGAE